MKKIFLSPIVFLLLLVLAFQGHAQGLYPNQECTDGAECKSGTCLRLRNGEKVCGTCSQSTFDNLAPKVDDYCKAFEDGWTPASSPEYNAMDVDGRVQVDVYDEMLEKAKACKQARINLQKECFEGGESYDKRKHAEQMNSIEGSIDRISKHKETMINAKRVYYCSKSTYEGALRQYDNECPKIDLNQMKQKFDAMNYTFGKGEKIDCDVLEDLEDDCKECASAVRELIKYGFRDTDSYTPPAFSDRLEAVEDMQMILEDLREKADNKDLCD